MPTVRLTWDDVNTGISQEDEVRIYRSETALDPFDLPTPIAVLPADATTHDDTSAAEDTVYFYGVGPARGNVIALATEQIEVGEGPPVSTTGLYEKTVAAGRYSVDLTGFQTKINLSGASADFWSKVATTDGGDIRVFDGNDVAIPFYIIEIDTVAQTGLILAKQTITTASATVFRVVSYDDPLMMPIAVDATGGRDDTWAGIEVAALLRGDLTDETGNGHDLTGTFVNTTPTYISSNIYGAGGGWDGTTNIGYARVNVPAFEGATFYQFVVCTLEVDPSTNPIAISSVATFGSNSDRKMLGQRDSSGEWTYVSTSNSWEESGTNVVLGEAVSLASQSRDGVSGEQDGSFYLNGTPVQTLGSGDIGRDELILGSGRGTSNSDWPGKIYMGMWAIIPALIADDWFDALDVNWTREQGLFEPEPIENLVVGLQ